MDIHIQKDKVLQYLTDNRGRRVNITEIKQNVFPEIGLREYEAIISSFAADDTLIVEATFNKGSGDWAIGGTLKAGEQIDLFIKNGGYTAIYRTNVLSLAQLQQDMQRNRVNMEEQIKTNIHTRDIADRSLEVAKAAEARADKSLLVAKFAIAISGLCTLLAALLTIWLNKK